MTQGVIDMLLDPIKTILFTTDPPVALFPGANRDTQDDLEKHSIFKRVSKASELKKLSKWFPKIS